MPLWRQTLIRASVLKHKKSDVKRWGLPFRLARLIMGTWLLFACTSFTPAATPSATPTLTTKFQISTVTPTATPEPTKAPPTPTAGSQGIPIEPLVMAARIFPHSWSSDSKMLAYRTFTAEEVAVDYTYPPGTMYFLNAHTGQVCESPVAVGYRYFGDSIAWLPDGKNLILADDQVIHGTPCGDDFTTLTNLFSVPILSFATTNSDRSMFLLSSQQGYRLYEPAIQSIRSIDQAIGGARPGYSWSPNNGRLAITAALDTPGFEAATSVVDVQTGKVEDVIKWQYRDAEGNFAGPIWLSEDQFLIQETVDQGPLLVTLGQDTVQVVSELFGTPFVSNSSVSLRAAAAVVTGTSTYHILLSGAGNEADFPQIRLYHSENGEVEELPFKYEGGFSPDGRSLVLFQSPLRLNEPYQAWMRPVDPTGGEARLLLSQNSHPLPMVWSPDGTKAVFSSSGGVSIFLAPDGAQVGFWETGEYSVFPGPWSPNGKLLAVQGYLPNGQGEGLFVIQVP